MPAISNKLPWNREGSIYCNRREMVLLEKVHKSLKWLFFTWKFLHSEQLFEFQAVVVAYLCDPDIAASAIRLPLLVIPAEINSNETLHFRLPAVHKQ